MVSYIHLPIVILCFFMLMSMRRWWLCIARMGYTKEVVCRAPSLFQRDILAATLVFMPFVMAVVDWFGLTLPRQTEPLPSMLAAGISLVCLCLGVYVLQNTGERFAGHWAGTRESALRTIAALRIIDAATLAHALQYVQEREAGKQDLILDAEIDREVRE